MPFLYTFGTFFFVTISDTFIVKNKFGLLVTIRIHHSVANTFQFSTTVIIINFITINDKYSSKNNYQEMHKNFHNFDHCLSSLHVLSRQFAFIYWQMSDIS
jgi:hypothetical protein